jgi:hypothetical protein
LGLPSKEQVSIRTTVQPLPHLKKIAS